MGKRKRKLSAEGRAERDRRRTEHTTIFVGGKQKRVKRPPMLEGLTTEEFIRANADPIWLHQNEMWEELAVDEGVLYDDGAGDAQESCEGRGDQESNSA